ncbi:HET-domain-containing protein [Lophiostoma macrostomum CBS 122681]|uniref:HET-domain-containing protein n=1 Tax=Lophiostoma macrostomum CBS 122681 TaxID=1314788 RepID=A0A6A6T238_9PLEO|nr:HET-domain-containing protein [Lophiostoma macrostomum CBS 122681]
MLPVPTLTTWASQAKKWLNHCLLTHPSHRSHAARDMPTRIIVVGDEHHLPYIHETGRQQGHWVSLSYVWGQKPWSITKLSNYEARKEEIVMDDLPKTIRDAVIMTRALGIQHLWIDALCIVQDSILDWERESANMCAVYANAILTIAAMDSPDSYSGLLTFNLRTTTRIETATSKKILTTRGWTMQELALSPRILWCQNTELAWSCALETACECTHEPRGRQREDLRFFNLNYSDVVHYDASDLVRWWMDLIQVYTDKQLTNSTDRLPALAGIAAFVQEMYGIRYLCGVWDCSWTFTRKTPHQRLPALSIGDRSITRLHYCEHRRVRDPRFEAVSCISRQLFWGGSSMTKDPLLYRPSYNTSQAGPSGASSVESSFSTI